MCEPVTLGTAATAAAASSAAAGTAAAVGTAAAAGTAAAGTAAAATAAAGAAAAAGGTAATAGLFGVGGVFSLGQTLSTLGMFSAIAGAGMSAYGSYQQSQTAGKVANYNAEVSRQQADYARKTSEIQAMDITRRGEEEAMMLGRKARQLAGEQRVALGAHGLDLTFGTAADIQEQTDFFAQADVARMRSNTQREAYMTRLAGTNAAKSAEAQAMSYSLQSEGSTPWVMGAGSLLTSLGSVSNKWYNYRDIDRMTLAPVARA